jgi:amino acid permease
VTRLIRLLGAAIGALIGLGFVLSQANLFDKTGAASLLILVWTAAWILVGYVLLPYMTVVPANRTEATCRSGSPCASGSAWWA